MDCTSRMVPTVNCPTEISAAAAHRKSPGIMTNRAGTITSTGPPWAWAMSRTPNPTNATALDASSGSIVRIILVRSPSR